MGCNRINSSDITPDDPSTANIPQIERNLAEVAALDPQPAMVFFVGDLIVGLTPDLNVLRDQLESWVVLYRNSELARRGTIPLIAMMGNHESLQGKKGSQISNPGAEQVWLDVMRPYIVGNNGPTAGGADHLASDQSQLTYSFEFRDSHFTTVNTDPFGAPATVPTHWIAGDLQGAADNPNIKHIFVLGHKPAFTPPTATESFSLDTFPALRDTFWDELNAAGAAAYLTAHAHVYYQSQPASGDQPDVKHAWQIVAGNAGSQVDPKWAASGDVPFFGFTVVDVLLGGHVIIRSYGRDFDPSNYLAPSPPEVFPTTVRSVTDITVTQ